MAQQVYRDREALLPLPRSHENEGTGADIVGFADMCIRVKKYKHAYLSMLRELE